MISLAILLGVCWLVVRRLLRENCAVLVVPITYALACMSLLALANNVSELRPWIVAIGLVTTVALTRTPPPDKLTPPPFSRVTWALLILFSVLVWAFTTLSQNLMLDDDFWIHFPIQGLLAREGRPVVHPFFPEILMNGHYGRDLLIGAHCRLAEITTYSAQAWQTTVAQLMSLWAIAGLVRRGAPGGDSSALLAVLFVFCGINVGGRTGLLDTFMNNNPLAYVLVVAVFRLFYLLWENSSPPRVVLTGFVLGMFALVYETHFGLMGLLLIGLLLATRRKEFALVGLLALLLACSQGGALSGLYRGYRQGAVHKELSGPEMTQHQVVRLTFPKEQLFEIRLGEGPFSRLSSAYWSLPDLGTVTSISPGTPYRPIWSWDVLQIHWVSTLLAPLSLAVLLRHRARPLGLGFWSFGLLAYLIPSLVHFGPVFESEYFRWQFAAGFGFALALAVAAGSVFEGRPPSFRWFGLGLLVLLNIFPTGTVTLPRVNGLAMAGQVGLRDVVLPRPEVSWLLSQSGNLSGLTVFDVRAAGAARKHSSPRQRILMNVRHHLPFGINFDSAILGLCRLRAAGRSLPWENEGPGTPPIHTAAPARVFWRYPSRELLAQLQADWILLRPGGEGTEQALQWVEQNATLVWQEGDYRLFRSPPREPSLTLRGCSSQADATVAGAADKPVGWPALPARPLTAKFFGVEPTEQPHRVWAWGFVKQGAPAETVDLREVVLWKSGASGVVFPPTPGEYDLRFFLVKAGWLHPTAGAIPVTVMER